MFDLDRLEEIWATIARNKWRSFMTAMSVFWAVMMLIIMSGAGIGMERMLKAQINIPPNTILMATSRTSEPFGGYESNRFWEINLDDAESIKREFPEINKMATVVEIGSKQLSIGNEKTSASVTGNTAARKHFDMTNTIFGRYINDIDENESRMVCVLGKNIYESLFPMRENPVGLQVKIGGSLFTVVGVQESTSNMINFGNSPNRSVVIPQSTAMNMFTRDNNISYLTLEARADADLTELSERIKQQLYSTHKIAPNDKRALMVVNFSELFKFFDGMFLGIRLLIWVVGLGSLFAGIIGVSNIMLIVIKERTQEIGVRRALGAKPFSIISQVMSESFLLTFIAGVLGMSASVGILSLAESIFAAMATDPLSQAPQFSPQVTFEFALVSGAIILVSGLLSGIIPALRAMAIKPVEAIREE